MLERYVIVERIAVGGMGEVFVARQEGVGNFRRTVVLKKLLPDAEGSDEAARRMLDEARVNGALGHENVVTIIEVGTEDDLPWLALEYVHGENCGTLRTRAGKRDITIPLAVAARITADSARGLQHAHEAKDVEGRPLNIIHRDIAPKNLFVRHDGVSKVGDFGIARADSQMSHTATGAIAGTLSYMSPEQLSGGTLTQQSDQFALGIVFWELLAGRRLFKGEGPVDTAEKILSGRVRPPSRYRTDVSAAVDAIVLRMLDRDPKRRFPDLGEVADAIERAVPDASPTVGRAAVAAFVEEMVGPELRERLKRIEEGAEQTTRGDRSRTWEDGSSSRRGSKSGGTGSKSGSGTHDPTGDPTLREGPAPTPMTQASPLAPLERAPSRSRFVVAAVAALAVVALIAVAVAVFRPREANLDALTLTHLEEAAKVKPLTFRETVVDDAVGWDIPEADAEALAVTLTALMRERFALLVLHQRKPPDVRARDRIDLVAKDQALLEKVRTALRPWGDAEFRGRMFTVWQWDSAAPIRFLPALTAEQIQRRVYPNGITYMKETRDQRWSQTDRLVKRAGGSAEAAHKFLEPLVNQREALLEKLGTAPAGELEGILRQMKILKEQGREGLTKIVNPDYAAAVAVAAFIGVPDTEVGEAQIDEKALVVDPG